MNPAAVIVILNGAILASAPPAQILFGHVMAPVAPVVTRFTERAVVDGDTITLVRQGRTCTFRIGSDAFDCDGVSGTLPVAPFGRGGVAYLPLADVARAFGGAVEYDPHTRIVALDVPPVVNLKTPAPFDPNAPSVTPTVIFAFAAAGDATAVDSGNPVPRRTAIPVVPSRGPEN